MACWWLWQAHTIRAQNSWLYWWVRMVYIVNILEWKKYYNSIVYNYWYSFSRKVLWLKCSSTNHDPKVIARYYLECVEQVGGIHCQIIIILPIATCNYCNDHVISCRLSKDCPFRLWNWECQLVRHTNCFQISTSWFFKSH